MNSVQLHDTLVRWAKADSLDGLANRVLDSKKKSPVKYNEVAGEVTQRIQEFTNENQKNFFSIDVPSIKKIKSLIPRLKNAPFSQKENLAYLETTLQVMLRLAKEKSDLLLQLPPVLTSLCEGYNTAEEQINLSIAEMSTSPQMMTTSINLADEYIISDLVEELRQRGANHPHIFDAMISKFFQNASLRAQNIFFKCLNEKEGLFLTKILNSIPKNLTIFSVIDCKCFETCHALIILENLKSLRTLTIRRCKLKQSQEALIEKISKNSQLQNLSLHLSTQMYAKEFAKILTLPKLRSLNISAINFCCMPVRIPRIPFSRFGEQSFISINQIFSNLAKMKLRNLNLANCNLTHFHLVLLLNTQSIKSLTLSNTKVSDEVVNEISQQNSSLEYLDIRGCALLSEDKILALVKKLNKLKELKFDAKNPEIINEISKVLKSRRQPSGVPETKKRKLYHTNDTQPSAQQSI